MITTILFDLYGVLRPDTYDSWLTRHNFERAGDFQILSEQLDANQITSEDFFNGLAQLSGQPSDVIRKDFENVQPMSAEVVELLTSLKNRYKLGLISNGSLNTRKRLELDGILALFDSVTISAEVGYIKPHPEIYRLALQSLDAKKEEVFYIDDNPRNVDAGGKYGIRSYLFTSLEDCILTIQSLK